MDLFIYLHTYITSSLELPSYLGRHRALIEFWTIQLGSH